MITQIANFHLFYPMLFTTIGVISLALIFAIKAILIKFKDTDSKNFLFKTHVEEHIDTTSKMKSMHDNVVKVDFTDKHEHELDEIEQTIDTHSTQLEQLTLKVEQIDIKVDELLNQFIELRKQNKL